MDLIEDLLNITVDASSDLGTLLRKCRILAARLSSQQLEDWLIWETNGYPKNVPVPEYRVWPLQVKGNFAGLYQSSISHQPIPPALLPEDARKSYNNYEFIGVKSFIQRSRLMSIKSHKQAYLCGISKMHIQ